MIEKAICVTCREYVVKHGKTKNPKHLLCAKKDNYKKKRSLIINKI
jgi:hypothetical protein